MKERWVWVRSHWRHRPRIHWVLGHWRKLKPKGAD